VVRRPWISLQFMFGIFSLGRCTLALFAGANFDNYKLLAEDRGREERIEERGGEYRIDR
jgi:hypothetical protein